MSYQNREEYIESLAQYVRENIAGRSIDDLREHLRSNGHSDDVIDEAILRA